MKIKPKLSKASEGFLEGFDYAASRSYVPYWKLREWIVVSGVKASDREIKRIIKQGIDLLFETIRDYRFLAVLFGQCI